MNKDQKDAIDRCIKDLCSELPTDLFLSHLVLSKIFSVSEQKSVLRNSTDEMVIFAALQLLKSKSGGWECLMEYINTNRYAGQWVADLRNCDSPAIVHQSVVSASMGNNVLDSKGNFNDRRKTAMDSLMAELQRVLGGGLEPFLTHLQRAKVIELEDWHNISRKYDGDKTRIFHLLNLLVDMEGSWEEILVFLYDTNRTSLAKKLQTAAGEPNIHPRPKA